MSPVSGGEVDAAGAFNYRYPIHLPSGTNGMAPELALAYNALAANGFLGMGWSLDGLSAITRDSSYSITYTDTTDHFLYGGQKLMYCPTDPRSPYHTERESYLRIHAFGLGTASSHWEVTRKDGVKYYYGNTSDSRIEAVGLVGLSGKVRVWALNRVEDRHGNYYVVEYAEDTVNGDYYPIRIRYSKNDAFPVNKERTIEFLYGSRSDHCPQWIPSQVDADKILRCIVLRVDASASRLYWLAYDATGTSARSRLLSIQEYGADASPPSCSPGFPWLADDDPPSGAALPATTFAWQEGGLESIEPVYPWGSNGADHYERSQLGDFNGDGCTDVISFESNRNFYVWLSDGSHLLHGTPIIPS